MIPDYVDITNSIADSLNNIFSNEEYTQIGILCDENTQRYCYPVIKDHLPEHHIFKIASGEEHKCLATCNDIWNMMTSGRFDRKSLLLNLGGGVIGDMGGFCAATFKRGIDFIQIPTTLLAQVDASIGGKLGVDFNGFKNHIGVFKLPRYVIIDPAFLDTLPDRQLKAGYAEMIKHGLIHNKEVFENLCKNDGILTGNRIDAITKSIDIKGDIVKSDPLEQGARKLLNFGHTIGHAIESLFLSGRDFNLLHGEAVAIGMICESWLSVNKLDLPEKELKTIADFIIRVYGKVDLQDPDADTFLKILEQDKKNKGNILLFTLLKEIGDGKIDISVSPDEALGSLEFYKNL